MYPDEQIEIVLRNGNISKKNKTNFFTYFGKC